MGSALRSRPTVRARMLPAHADILGPSRASGLTDAAPRARRRAYAWAPGARRARRGRRVDSHAARSRRALLFAPRVRGDPALDDRAVQPVPFALLDACSSSSSARGWRSPFGISPGGRAPVCFGPPRRLRPARSSGRRRLYLVFLLVWGLNYRRTPLREKLPFDARAVTADAARSLALTSVEQLNALHDAAHAAAGRRPARSIRRWRSRSRGPIARSAVAAWSPRDGPSRRCSTGTSAGRRSTA